MSIEQINLVKTDFPQSNLFNYLPKFSSIYFKGQALEHVLSFSAERESQECGVLAVTIIRKDENFLWDSTRDLLDRAVKNAAFATRGIYTFNLLTFDLHKENNFKFNHNELAQVLINSSLKLRVGEQVLIKYLSMYGLLQKIGDESWGKIVFKTSVEIFNDKPNFLFALVSRILKTVEFAHNPVLVLVNDLSTFPLYDPANEKQKYFLDKLITEQAKNSIEFPPEVYIQDRHGVRELLSRTVVKKGGA
ncbi:MAG: hypothetical protein HQL26_00895 [Candidatus Omnitrophica bacterium]|nr:hypothetical protein [Candidatus Omnitrophota bacterium]